MLEKDNHMKTFIGISATAAVLAGILIVSCAPVPLDTSKNQSSHSQSLANQTPSAQVQAQDAAIDGQWVCDTGSSCAYSSVVITAEDGIAVLNGGTQESAKLVVGANSETSLIQLNMTIVGLSGSAANLAGSVSQGELTIGADTYSKAAAPAAANPTKN